MTAAVDDRALLLMDGSSDAPLAQHLEELSRRAGRPVRVVALDVDRLPIGAGRTVTNRLRAALKADPGFSLVFVHRDAEAQDPELRYTEVADAVVKANFPGRHVAVVPVRKTEAWLLLDELAIRTVAGRPTGRVPLPLPPVHAIESHPDPKALLREVLLLASGATGRRREQLTRRFPQLRRQLLDRLDVDGPVTRLPSWSRLADDIAAL